MNLNYFIANKIGEKKIEGKNPSNLSNKIATFSVAISIIVMFISIAILNGFKREIFEKTVGFSGDITINAPGANIINNNYYINRDYSPIKYIDSLEIVKQVQPISYRSGLLKTNDQIEGVILKGVDSLYNFSFFEKHLYAGEIPKYGKKLSNDILISKRLADLLGYKIGDKAICYFIGDDIKVRSFIIKGIYNAQLEEIDKSFIIADIAHINRLNGWKNGEISGYEILLKHNSHNDKSVDVAESQILELIYKHTQEKDESATLTLLRDNFYVLTDWLTLMNLNVIIILTLMIAVAGINMVSGIFIILFENISRIGLLKALGMQNRNIAKIFLIKGASIVGKGLLWGNLVAGIFCYIQWRFKIIELDPQNYFINYVPIDLSVSTIIAINIISFIVIMAIINIPCYFISKISPAKSVATK